MSECCYLYCISYDRSADFIYVLKDQDTYARLKFMCVKVKFSEVSHGKRIA